LCRLPEYLIYSFGMQSIVLICGVSGAGKTWVCKQLQHKFHYVPHDRCWVHPTKTPEQTNGEWTDGAISTHIEELVKATQIAQKPVLTESPFGERVLREALEKKGIQIIPYFVIEPTHVVQRRYYEREKKALPKAAATRSQTIVKRADEWQAPRGTSLEVLVMLQSS
jgi:adenylate kinase family enzyme